MAYRALWHIEQPISLKFNGEKLQIIEDGNIIEEYEARSGQMENRDVAVTNTNVLTQHDNQTVSDNQTQDNNTLPLNIVNDNENLKAVHYPGYSAGNTLNIVKNEKFYYDDKATNKIPEGSYYIMANDIKTNPNISKDALNVQGSKYMHMFEHHNIDFTDEKSFNNIITTKDYIMNVTSHYNNFITSNIIHGGIEYGDKGGIDLSENADNFFKDLTKLIKDKPLYKVYGKVPIKLEVNYNKMLILEVIRKWGKYGASTIPTISEFKLFKNHKCILNGHILEREGPDTLDSGKLRRIPEGIYNASWWESSISFSYTHSDYIIKNVAQSKENNSKSNILPNLYNDNVDKKRYILIHNGNYIEQSKGCLLLGVDKLKQRNNTYYDMVTDSNKILKNFIEELIKHDPISYKNYSTNPTIKNFKIIIKNDFIE